MLIPGLVQKFGAVHEFSNALRGAIYFEEISVSASVMELFRFAKKLRNVRIAEGEGWVDVKIGPEKRTLRAACLCARVYACV